MILERLFGLRKSRKYPIQYDNGQSLRARCFRLFDEGERPDEVAKELKMKKATARKYFRQWKLIGPDFEKKYTYVRELLKGSAPNRDQSMELFAKACGISKEELEAILAKPHGLRRLMTGRLDFPGQANTEHKLHISLELALLISDHLINNSGKIKDVLFAFENLMKVRMEFRKEEDVDTEEENQRIEFTRHVLEAAAKAEQEGRVIPDRLSDDEQAAAFKYGMEAKITSAIRDLETQYWARLGELMAEGLSAEQAREKIYQDLLEAGDPKGAEAVRNYQDILHPLKGDDPVPPPSPSQPPSAA